MPSASEQPHEPPWPHHPGDDAMQRLTWARIRHDQAFRASLRSRPAPPATRIVAKLLAGTVRDASTRRFADPATGWQRRNFLEAEDESTLRIAPGNLVSLPGLAARIGPGDHRPGAVPRRQRHRLRAQLLAMGGLRRRRPARSTAVWQVRSLVCGDRVTVVCGWLAGNAQRRHQQGQPWSPPNALDANRASLHPRWPAVWHRDVPLSHLPRGAGILLAAGIALAPVAGLLPLGWQPKIAIPTG